MKPKKIIQGDELLNEEITLETTVLDNKPFDDAILKKGYNVTIEQAIVCPCMTGGQHLFDCPNCRGIGWVWLDKIQTKMLLQSQNSDTKFKEWTEEQVGRVNMSYLGKYQPTYMTRVTVLDGFSTYSQIAKPFEFEGQFFAYLVYPVIDIEIVFYYKQGSKLVRLIKDTDYWYTKETNVIEINPKFITIPDFRVSLIYKHQIQYYVLDVIKELRVYKVFDGSSYIEKAFPNNATGRRCHNVMDLDAENKSKTLLFDNSVK